MVGQTDSDRPRPPHERDIGRRGAGPAGRAALGPSGAHEAQFIELGPLTPLHLLLTDGGATDGK